jgi:3-deoxy-D-manno-octulosonic-acid transferase
VLEEVDLFLMQGEIPARRIRDLGAPVERVSVTHSLKYDAAEPGRPPERLRRLFDGTSHRPLWVAGCTVGGEEERVLRAFHLVRERVKDAALLIAPRHPERFAEVPPLVEAAGFRCRRRSALEPGGWGEGDVLLLDTLGELAQLYTLASVVFVGKSLGPTQGGHNILEPAAAAKPIVVGPHMQNFQEIFDEFKAEGAIVEVQSAEELGREVAALLLDEPRRRALGERARRLVERNRGAVQRTVEALGGLVA